MDTSVQPPVAWKNEPCGRWSSTVAPALTIDAPQTPGMPASRTAPENDDDAIVAPAVVEALRRRVEHGIFGYAKVPESYYAAITGWFARRHGWAPAREWIRPVTGVIPALSAILRALTRPGDKVLMQTPVYNHFFISVANSGCAASRMRTDLPPTTPTRLISTLWNARPPIRQ